MRLQHCPGGMLELLSNPAHRFNHRHKLCLSESQERAVIGRPGSLGTPSPYSSYLMDQVFLQDSTQLRRLRSSSAFRGEAAVPPNQKESCWP
ncbi:hypothetical protein FQA47_005337 [Oryzias melastigma]|uniref:Uncharacterized protein n=1 Tax=Oryzias melastigma TaxID=30732 RepID=A0A834CN04_ORYME|nr:hypothetical protein FQA47_005337 [Oryzias melastigma]